MKIIKNSWIPKTIYNAILKKRYIGKLIYKYDYSITELINAPIITILTRRHYDEIVVMASTKIKSMMGSALHFVLEKANSNQPLEDIYELLNVVPKDEILTGNNKSIQEISINIKNKIIELIDSDKFTQLIIDSMNNNSSSDFLPEQRFLMEVNNKIIGGEIDFINKMEKSINDYKNTGVSSYFFLTDKMEGFKKQLNGYKVLFEHNSNKFGFDFLIEALNIIMYFSDWNQSESLRNVNYPKQIEVIKIPIVDKNIIINDWIKQMKIIDELELVPDDELPVCTQEERWQSPTRYAVIKRNLNTGGEWIKNKKATRVLNSEDDAKDYIKATCINLARKDMRKPSMQKQFINLTVEDLSKKYIKNYVIDKRLSEPIKCARGYCDVREFCPFYKNYIKELNSNG